MKYLICLPSFVHSGLHEMRFVPLVRHSAHTYVWNLILDNLPDIIYLLSPVSLLILHIIKTEMQYDSSMLTHHALVLPQTPLYFMKTLRRSSLPRASP